METINIHKFAVICSHAITYSLPKNLDVILEEEDLHNLQGHLLSFIDSAESDFSGKDSNDFVQSLGESAYSFLDNLGSKIISLNADNPKVYFKTIDDSVNPLDNVRLSLVSHAQKNITDVIMEAFDVHGYDISALPVSIEKTPMTPHADEENRVYVNIPSTLSEYFKYTKKLNLNTIDDFVELCKESINNLTPETFSSHLDEESVDIIKSKLLKQLDEKGGDSKYTPRHWKDTYDALYWLNVKTRETVTAGYFPLDSIARKELPNYLRTEPRPHRELSEIAEDIIAKIVVVHTAKDIHFYSGVDPILDNWKLTL